MNLRQLEAFRAAMEVGSITGAAAMLHVSQPSVSRLISDLEVSVGFPLFLRSGRGIVATVEARRFYHAVDNMFVGVSQLQDVADAIRNTAGGVVAIGVIPAFSHIVMPEAIRDLYNSREDVRIMVSTRNTPSIVDAVRMQQFDLGVVGRSPPYAGVEILFETDVPYLCLLPETHRLAADPKICLDLENLAGTEEFVTFGGAYPDDMLDLDPELSERMRAKSRLSAANMPVAASIVRETGALAIVDPFTASVAEKLGGVVSRPIEQKLKYHVAVITRGLDTLSREARDFSGVFIEKLTESMA